MTKKRVLEKSDDQPLITSFFQSIGRSATGSSNLDDSNDKNVEDAEEISSKKVIKKSKITKKSKQEQEEEEEEEEKPKKVSKKTTTKKSKKVVDDEEEEEEEEEEEKPKKLTKKTTKKSKKEVEEEEEEENEDKEEEEEAKSSPKELYNDVFDHLTDESWKKALEAELGKPYISKLIKSIESSKRPIYPPKDEIFTAFNSLPLNKVKVVIVGQDPYFNENQAHGLCFSVKKGVRPPPSLANMYKELKNTVDGFEVPQHGYLQSWADQGVFLLNATLTVTGGSPNSHEKFGWATFTDAVMNILNQQEGPIVFILWGGFAKKKGAKIDRKKHLVLESGHPSPLSVKHFMGCDHFRKTNDFLKSKSLPEIDWKLPTVLH